MRTDSIHTSHAGCPTTAGIAPMEKSKYAGTPHATQKASRHVRVRCSPGACEVTAAAESTIVLTSIDSQLHHHMARHGAVLERVHR